MNEQIQFALKFVKERYEKNLNMKAQVRQARRRQDEFVLVQQYQLPLKQHLLHEARDKNKQHKRITSVIENIEYFESNHEIFDDDALYIASNLAEDDKRVNDRVE